MAKKTFEKEGRRRSTSLPSEQVALRASGWAEVKPAKRAPKKLTEIEKAGSVQVEAEKPAEDKPADKSENTSK